MSYERDLQRAQTQTFAGRNAANDERERVARMSKDERLAYDAERAAGLAALVAQTKADNEAKKAAAAAEREAAEAERRRLLEAEDKAKARRMWAGDDASFERQWPGMYEAMLAQRTVEQLKSAQQQHREFIRGAF